MSVEPRIPLLLDDASNLSRGHSNWSPHRFSQNYDPTLQTDSGTERTRSGKLGVSLAQVLNIDTATDDSSDFTLPPAKRQRFEEGSSGTLLQLPLQLPKPEVKKKDRRSRIPPLIQGLHQPPPDAGLFPPITANSKHEAHAPSLQQEKELEPRLDQSKETNNDLPAQILEIAEEQTTKERQIKQPRKKNKWTKEETADLLKGVAKFGMGNWKAILSYDGYSFNGRSAIDLKDRFRTCCPEAYRRCRRGEASNSKKSKTTVQLSSDEIGATPASLEEESNRGEPTELETPKPKSARSHRLNPEELAELGIEGPFSKKRRRERRVWTEDEDAALLKGLNIHGLQWAQIRNDSELGLQHRLPTDLRDRVRNRWPEKYKDAGRTIRPKDIPRPLQRAGKAPEQPKPDVSSSPHSEQQPVTPPENDQSEPEKSVLTKETPTRINRVQPPPPPLKLLNAPIPDPFAGDFPELGSFDEMVPASPITLDRSIFDWVNQNITQASTSNPAPQQHPSIPTNSLTIPPTTNFSDVSLNGFDSLHINPLVTLNKPYKNFGSNAFFPLVTPPSLQNSTFAASAVYNNTTSNNIPNMLSAGLPSMNPGHTSAASAKKASAGAGTAAGANANAGALNLPPPAEVLAGFWDMDTRGESHASATGPLLWDDLLN